MGSAVLTAGKHTLECISITAVLSEAASYEAAWKQHDVPEVGIGEHRKEKGEQDYLEFVGGIEKQLKQEV